MSQHTTFVSQQHHLDSTTALVQPSNSNFIKGGIGGAGNYRKNEHVCGALTFDSASGQSVRSVQYPTAGAATALPSGADKMKEKLVGLFRSGK